MYLMHLFEIEISYNIINVFTLTFDQYNTYLLNICIHFFSFFKLLTDPKRVNGSV